MTKQEASLVVEMLTGNLAYFPSKPAAQGLVTDELTRMCGTIEQGAWLARRMCQLLEKWEGVKEMRAIYCSKFKPLDGIEVASGIYLDGIPSEKESRPMLEAAPMKALPARVSASVDPEGEKHVTELVQARAMPPVKRFRTITEDEDRVDKLLRSMHGMKESE